MPYVLALLDIGLTGRYDSVHVHELCSMSSLEFIHVLCLDMMTSGNRWFPMLSTGCAHNELGYAIGSLVRWPRNGDGQTRTEYNETSELLDEKYEQCDMYSKSSENK